MSVAGFDLSLVRSPDDLLQKDPAFQAELRAFGTALHDAGVAYSQSAITFDSIDAYGYPLAEFAIQQLEPPTIAEVHAVLGAWVHARASRKVRIKIGDIEVEVHIAKDAEQLLRVGVKLDPRPEQQKHG